MSAKRCHRLCHLCWGQCVLNALPGACVRAHHADDRPGQMTRRLDDPLTAYRMSDQHHLLQPQLLYHSHNILTESWHGPLGAVVSRRPMPREIEAHHGVAWRKVAYLPVP